jgi:thioredoxin reductase (NADPH)
MDTNNLINLVIIGSGPAGLTAGIYSARAGLNPVIIGGLKFGGQLMDTTLVENFPGFVDGIQGPDLMMNMLHQAEKFGAKIIYENAKSVDFTGEVKTVTLESEKVINSKAVIIATGAVPRKLGIESETKYWGKGVSSCATCDGPFYRGKEIAVIGGGDSAIEEALFLTQFATKVYLIHRRNELRACKAMQDKLKANSKIEIILNTLVLEVLGQDGTVSCLKIKDLKTNEEKELPVSGMFLGIGHHPNTDIFKGILEIDKDGYLVVKYNTKTSIAGIFVAGDVKDKSYQQAITAAGMGCMAALDAEEYLLEGV